MVADSRPQGIFGVPLRQSITYANVAISLIDENGKSYIYGYVPIVVAKCGVFLKEKGSFCPTVAIPRGG
jgi:GTPase-activating protein SAC7